MDLNSNKSEKNTTKRLKYTSQTRKKNSHIIYWLKLVLLSNWSFVFVVNSLVFVLERMPWRKEAQPSQDAKQEQNKKEGGKD